MPEQMREAMGEALDRRAAMEKAFDTLTTESEGAGKVVTDSTPSGGAKPSDGAGEQVVKPEGDGETASVAEEKPAITDKVASKSEKPVDAKAQKPGEKTAKPADTKGTPPSRFKAPTTWKPDIREDWSKIPPRAQQEILRREAEVNQTLNQTAAARKFSGEFQNIIRPYEAMIRAAGVTPLQAINNLVQTAGGLQAGTANQKAAIVARLIGMYGVDIAILDGMLAGKAPKGGSPANDDALLQAVDKRLKPLTDFVNGIQNSRAANEEALGRESLQTADQFAADPENEFFEDLREDIADILELAANRGRSMTLKEAYDRAAAQNPQIAKVVTDRKAAKEAEETAKNLDRSRRAASSQPSGSPGGIGPSGAKPGNRKDALTQAWNDLEAR
jgi:hypothetical protein